ncbi:hypothetical protein NGR_c19400 [Sinorhizobium fredii NGR234]|uniref:Uncharacterized protein n=1 Tax=Sinorhizobium fredii (strain NBRC 101917 / NGR234) TaxID=394 RepID=C3ME34_SINFN|nr:hypothetical protein NGR_c19400 [Sinorhizobium fredii NGR234]
MKVWKSKQPQSWLCFLNMLLASVDGRLAGAFSSALFFYQFLKYCRRTPLFASI